MCKFITKHKNWVLQNSKSQHTTHTNIHILKTTMMLRYIVVAAFLATVKAQCPATPPGGCSVCGEGLCVGNPDAIFAFPGFPAVPCGTLEEAGYSGTVPSEQCPFLPGLITDCDCGTGSAPAPTPAPVAPVPAPVAPVPAPTQPPAPASTPTFPPFAQPPTPDLNNCVCYGNVRFPERRTLLELKDLFERSNLRRRLNDPSYDSSGKKGDDDDDDDDDGSSGKKGDDDDDGGSECEPWEQLVCEQTCETICEGDDDVSLLL